MDQRKPPIIPPLWFVQRLNVTRAWTGLPWLSPLDAVAMMAWHLFTTPPPTPLVMITGV